MCGCESHGKLTDALRNGGCGISFKWGNLEIADDPCGFKDVDGTHIRGRPMTARQLKPKNSHPKCARPECNYFKCTDGMRLGHHNAAPSNKNSNGGEYCCDCCRSGRKNHSAQCHKIPVPGFNKAAAEAALAAKRAQDGGVALTKWLVPFDAYGIQISWKASDIKEAVADQSVRSIDLFVQVLSQYNQNSCTYRQIPITDRV